MIRRREREELAYVFIETLTRLPDPLSPFFFVIIYFAGVVDAFVVVCLGSRGPPEERGDLLWMEPKAQLSNSSISSLCCFWRRLRRRIGQGVAEVRCSNYHLTCIPDLAWRRGLIGGAPQSSKSKGDGDEDEG